MTTSGCYVTRTDLHAHAVILAALIFFQQRIGFRIKKIGVRIEHMQHAGNGPVVDRLIGVDRLGVVRLDNAVDFGKFLQAVTNVVVGTGRNGGVFLREQHAQKSASCKKQDDYNEAATRTAGHLKCPSTTGIDDVPRPLLSKV